MLQRITAAAILGQACIAVVGVPLIIQHHIFNDGTAANRVPDDRFIFATQIDGLGVATALYIEHGPLGPAVLIIANEVALRVCGQSGLASARQAEKQRGVAVFSNVGGAVHGHDILLRKQEILYREHGFFHLACVTHSRDEHFSLAEIDDHRGVRVGAVPLGVTDKVGHIEDLPLGLIGRIVGVRADEHVAAKE